MASKDIIIVGAGGLGRETLFQIREINKFKSTYNIIGFVDDRESHMDANINGIPVLGKVSCLLDYNNTICAVVCIANPFVKRSIVNLLQKNENIVFPNIIAPDLRFSDYVNYGIGCIIGFSNIITIDVSIKDFVLISNACTVGHDSIINSFTTVYNAVNISGNVRIGSCAEIGTGTKIIQGRTIGDNAILGAGSIVVRDIPKDCTAVGIPASPIKYHIE